MSLDLSNATNGVKRFIEYALNQNYHPCPIELTPENRDRQPITLVFATYQIYFLVRPQYPHQRIPRRVIKNLIDCKDLEYAFREGEKYVQEEMEPGNISPFVSDHIKNFKVYLNRDTFEGNRDLIFKLGNSGSEGFGLPAYAFRDLLIGLYGEEKIEMVNLFNHSE